MENKKVVQGRTCYTGQLWVAFAVILTLTLRMSTDRTPTVTVTLRAWDLQSVHGYRDGVVGLARKGRISLNNHLPFRKSTDEA